ncbi:MAG: hypothetical protein WC637_04780 [Victivallales bacterium]|jgi:hypothetical protein
MKNYYKIMILLVLCLGYWSNLFAQTQLPSAWMNDKTEEWDNNNWTVTTPLVDVKQGTNASGTEREYYVIIPDSEGLMDETTWKNKAFAGCFYPSATISPDRFGFGVLLYHNNANTLAIYNSTTVEQETDNIFNTLKTLNSNFNTVLLCSYILETDWAWMEILAEEHDMSIMLQYHRAYLPNDGNYSSKLPLALDILGECASSSRLVGFSIKEEPYVGTTLEPMQDYHDDIWAEYPDLPVFCTYNSTAAMAATESRYPEIMGSDIYRFLGGYFSTSSQTVLFESPQTGLRQYVNYLKEQSHESLKRGSIYYLMPNSAGYTAVYNTADLETWKQNEWPGVKHLANGKTISYRRYTAPENCMRATLWLAVSFGAQAFLPWYFQPELPWETPPSPENMEQRRIDYAYDGAENSSYYQEYSDSIDEVIRYESVIVNTRPDGFPRVEKDMDNDVADLLTSRALRFVPENGGSNVVVLTNLDVGRWNNYPTVAKTAPFNLDVDQDGMLTGYTPLTTPRAVTFKLRLDSDEFVYRIKSGEQLTVSSGPDAGTSLYTFSMDILPGDGEMLFIGSASEWASIQSTINAVTTAETDDQKCVSELQSSPSRMGVGTASSTYPYYKGITRSYLQFKLPPNLENNDIKEATLKLDITFTSSSTYSPTIAACLVENATLSGIAYGDEPDEVSGTASAGVVVNAAGQWELNVTGALQNISDDTATLKVFKSAGDGNRHCWWSSSDKPVLEVKTYTGRAIDVPAQ